MPRPLSSRMIPQEMFSIPAEDPPAYISMVIPPRGMHTAMPLPRMAKDVCRLVEDMVYYEGTYKTRIGTTVLGPSATEDILYAQEFIVSTGNSFVIRWKSNCVEWYNSGSWVEVVGPPLNGKMVDLFSTTGWGDKVIFTNGSQKLYELDLTTLIPTYTELTDSPAGAFHVSTFYKHVIASLDNGIYWSVSGNNADWNGLSSGYEDFLSGPIERQCAVIPVTDILAFVIRSNSVRSMRPTGDFDVPFQFEELYTNVGSLSPASVARIKNPSGVIFVSHDSVILATPSEFRDIGLPIRRELSFKPQALQFAWGVYDPREDTYRLLMEDKSGIRRQWRYNVGQDIWTRDNLQFIPRTISFTRLAQSISIDEATEIIDHVSEAIDYYGLIEDIATGIYATQTLSGDRFVVRDSATTTSSATRDVDNYGHVVAGGFRIETGYVNNEAPVKRTEMIAVDIEYEANRSTSVVLEYSIDGGLTWNLFSSQILTATTKSELARFTGRVEARHFQIAIKSSTVGVFQLHGVYPKLSTGSEIADAG